MCHVGSYGATGKQVLWPLRGHQDDSDGYAAFSHGNATPHLTDDYAAFRRARAITALATYSASLAAPWIIVDDMANRKWRPVK